MGKKVLIIRLSSLGDIILASSVLDSFTSNHQNSNNHGTIKYGAKFSSILKDAQIDWAVAQEYSELLKDHPRIHKLWTFNRRLGLTGWYRFCRQLWNENYSEVLDLHQTLRTRLMKIFFLYWRICEGSHAFPRWLGVSKQRLRLYFYFIFKRLWPKSLRPSPWIGRYLSVLAADPSIRPNLKYLLKDQPHPSVLEPRLSDSNKYFCIMPSTKWAGKEWPVQSYVQVVKNQGAMPVILGMSSDAQSVALVKELTLQGLPFVDGVGLWSLSQTAAVLSHSIGYLGGDTGLSHLAQALGVKVIVLYGPTAPDGGFGPWGVGSQAIETSLVCRPCGKDGRFCYRIGQRYECMRAIPPFKVLEEIKSSWGDV